MIELTDLRVFSETSEYLGRFQGLLLLGVDEEAAEIFYCTPWTSEDEAVRLLNSRYASLATGALRDDSSRAEGLMEFDNLRGLCAELNAILDEQAENEAYPGLIGDEDSLLEEAFGDAPIHLLTTMIEQAKQRLFTIAEDTELQRR